MKMRIQGQTLRFRLNRREVEDFAGRGRLEASIGFPGGGGLAYSLETSISGQVDARFDEGAIRIRVPAPVVLEWAAGDTVGIHALAAVANGPDLEIIVEKDFQCLHKGEEGKDPDAWPNPAAPPHPADR